MTRTELFRAKFVARPRLEFKRQLSLMILMAPKKPPRLLASDFADYMLKTSAALRCRDAAALRRVVGRLMKQYEIIFSSIDRKLDSRMGQLSAGGVLQLSMLSVKCLPPNILTEAKLLPFTHLLDRCYETNSGKSLASMNWER